MSKFFVSDFETVNDPEDCRVWGWGSFEIENEIFNYGTDISEWMDWVLSLPDKTTIYFHNLKFDGEFILYELFKRGFTHTTDRFLMHKEFSTLISFMGVFYSISFSWKNKKYTLIDSLKILPMPVKRISKAFGLSQLKGEIDYNKFRPIGYEPNEVEIEYIKNDVEIVGRAINQLFDQGLKKMTQASNALSDFKKIMKKSKQKFDSIFPILEQDEDLRKSYKGGFTYVNPKYQGREIKDGIVFDVNSLYPSVMYNEKLPFGEPVYYEGSYLEDKIYNLYIQCFTCNFELKKDMIPTIQLKNSLGFKPTEYATSSKGLDITMTLTSVDFELFKKHYDIFNIEFHYGWKFKSTSSVFKSYIDKWSKVKIDATINKNEGMRTMAKLMLNALYGKFGLNPIVKSKYPTMNTETGKIDYKMGEEEKRDPIYIPMASFITAYARELTISSAQLNFDRFIYADTDSIHLVGSETPDNIEVDPVKLGAWKEEYKFKRARFIRAKSYIEETGNKGLHIACAGLPDRCKTHAINDEEYQRLGSSEKQDYALNEKEGKYVRQVVTFENFKNGLVVDGKLQHSRVQGGVVLKETSFTIKI